MVSVLRPGDRIHNLPGIGVQTSRRAVSSGAAAWYLAGGAPVPVAVWQPIGAASLAASYLRIVGSAGYANIDPAVVGGVAPTFNAATGWGTNGTNQYLKTGVVIAGTWSFLLRMSGATAALKYIAGVSTANQAFFFFHTSSAQLFYNNTSGTSGISSSGAPGNDVLAIAGVNAYRNGVAVPGTMPGTAQAISAVEIGRVATNYFPGNIQAVAIWDTSTGHGTWMPQVMAAAAAL